MWIDDNVSLVCIEAMALEYIKNDSEMTQRQRAMLKDIQEGENDGIGMGYSEFDGFCLTPEEKGVLGSLVAEGYVYNSHEEDPFNDPMYCSTMKAPRLIDESMHDRTIK